MKRTKVAHIISSLSLGGVEKGIQLSVEKLNQAFDYKVYTLSSNNRISINNKYIYFGKFRYILFSFFFTLQQLIKNKPDVIIVSLWRSVAIALLYKKILKKKVFLIAFIHSETYFHFLDSLFSRLIIKNADAIACDSVNTLLSQQRNLKKTSKAYVIPYIFIHERGFVKSINKGHCIKFLFAGRITPIKNIESILAFFAELNKCNIDFQFDIYGTGDEAYITLLKNKIDHLNIVKRVTFKGQFDIDTAVDIFNMYHFYIQFSKNEGMAMSVVDSMLCGLVPIVTPVGEIKNYVIENNNGLILSHKDGIPEYEKLIDKLQSLVNNPDLYHYYSENSLLSFKAKMSYTTAFEKMIFDISSD